MKNLYFFLLLLVIGTFSACKSEEPDPGQLAAVAAKGYYDLLLQGKYEDFIDGVNRPYQIPEGYRKQLLLNAQMFAEQQDKEHQGMKSVEIITAKADTAHHVADVFLSISYGDSTKEQVVVPMVEVKGTWRMR